MTQELIAKYVQQYLELFPFEAERCERFKLYLKGNSSENLYSKQNFDGHITTSAFILNNAGDALLMVAHKALQLWLQPGGHVESDNSLWLSALREAVEETGLSAHELQAIHMQFHATDVPFDIDSHYIPANAKKGTPGHYHHDFRYLFQYKGNGSLVFQPDESTGIGWIPLAQLQDDAMFASMVAKMRPFLN